MCIFNPGEVFIVWGVIFDDTPQSRFQLLVRALSLVIGLKSGIQWWGWRWLLGCYRKISRLEIWTVDHDVKHVWWEYYEFGKHEKLGAGLSQRLWGSSLGTQTDLEKWFTILSYPPDGGSPAMKSRTIWDQGRLGTGRGCRRPAGVWLPLFLRAQTVHAKTNSLMSLYHEGHNKYFLKDNMRVVPGWHMRQWLWTQPNAIFLRDKGVLTDLGDD